MNSEHAADPPAPTIEGIEMLRRIGTGGYSTVYRGFEPRFKRDVAVKVMHAEDLDDASRVRIERECAAIGTLSSSHYVVPPYRYGTTSEGLPYLVMEYCPGGSLGDRLRDSGPLPTAKAVDLAEMIAAGLTEVHRAGLIHSDIKPANVLIRKSGDPALADFGLSARLDGLKAQEGGYSPEYAAPEVHERGEYGVPADLYSFGALLYALLDGASPFPCRPGESVSQHIRRVRHDPAPPLSRQDVPDDLRELLASLLAKRPADRPRSAAEVQQRLANMRRSLVPSQHDHRAGRVSVPSPSSEATRKRTPVEPSTAPLEPGRARVPHWLRWPRWRLGLPRVRRPRTVMLALLTVFLAAAGTLWWTQTRGPDLVDYTGSNAAAPVRLGHPAAWTPYDVPGQYVLFSPTDLRDLFSSEPAGWSEVTRQLEADPTQVVGAYVRTGSPINLDDVTSLQSDVLASMRGTRVGWDADVHDEQVNGQPARALSGVLRPANGTTAIRFRDHITQAQAGGATLHILFFAASDLFDEQGQQFEDVLDSVKVRP